MSFQLDFSQYGYKILNQLGQNFTGGRTTYKAINVVNKQTVVIKQFQFAQSGGDWSQYRDIEQEIQVLKSLNHPNIPQYINSFETDTGFCLVQEYKQAVSLDKSQQLTFDEIKQTAIIILKILVYLQTQNPPIIHRDIKPENILISLTDDIEHLKVYLVDFGFARINSQDLAYSSVVKGTLGFMPPEQIFNLQLTESSDLYSLGVTLMCLISGTKSTDISQLVDENYRFDFSKIKSKVNQAFYNWLGKMTEPKVSDRYQNAKDALIDLEKSILYFDKLDIAIKFKNLLINKYINSPAVLGTCITASIFIFWMLPMLIYTNKKNEHNSNIVYRRNEVNYLHEQGLLMLEKGNEEQAINFFEQAISLNPNKDVSWYHKAVSLRNTKKYEESLDTFAKLKEISPDWHYTWMGEAVTLSLMNREEDALISMNKAIDLEANDSHLWTNQGFIYMRMKRYAEAKKSFEKALDIEPDNPYAKRKLRKVIQKLK